jgi:hypothetical protein
MTRFARNWVALRAPQARTSAPNSSAQSASRLLQDDGIVSYRHSSRTSNYLPLSNIESDSQLIIDHEAA